MPVVRSGLVLLPLPYLTLALCLNSYIFIGINISFC
nr:MAG TPA: hypothetical protein [Crassvirales sp.]